MIESWQKGIQLLWSSATPQMEHPTESDSEPPTVHPLKFPALLCFLCVMSSPPKAHCQKEDFFRVCKQLLPCGEITDLTELREILH